MLRDSTVPLPLLVAHADWSSNPEKRWLARAMLENGRYTVHAPMLVGEPSTLLRRLRTAAGGVGTVLVGFDFPIGVPTAYAKRASVESFLALLSELGQGKWSDFYEIAERPDHISLHRPFYPRDPRPKGSKKRSQLLEGLGVGSMNELLRRCDRAHDERGAAASMFWLIGGNQVGRAAIAGWSEVLAPALRSADLDVAVWPFNGDLSELLRSERVVVVETYPREFYQHLGIKFSTPQAGQRTGKRVQIERQENAPALFAWANANEADLSPGMRAAIRDGFGSLADGEDRFDAAVGLFGMLNVVLGRRPSGEPMDATVRMVEGWMFGQLANPNDRSSSTEPSTRKDVVTAAASPAEYDNLSDLYDLEYSHSYDVPFWLALAEREGNSIVEWGAGTGRIAIPLAEAGFGVTAVELSERMVEEGRKKSDKVEWIHGDMRSAKLGRRYNLAVCAFNSFLCLLNLDGALAFLRNAREHLEPGGLFGLEVSAFSPEELAEEPGGPELRHDFTRELPDGRLDRFSVSRYDPASQLLRMRLFYELYGASGELKERRAHDLTIRVVGRAELELMLRLAGFEVEAVHGGFAGEPFAAGSDHLVVLARK
jgi:SAM-dependent methyltransferase